MQATRLVAIECGAGEPIEPRAFEPIVAALEDTTPHVELIRPGLCVFPTRGPSRYFGGEAALVQRVVALLADVCSPNPDAGIPTVGVGVADGYLAATLAARTSCTARPALTVQPVVVPKEASANYLSPMSVEVLGDEELAGVLQRLGLRTVGAFCEIGTADVLARFGREGVAAQLIGRGEDLQPFHHTKTGVSVEVATELDPPLENVEAAGFVGRGLAVEFQSQLEPHGLMASLVKITAETTEGFSSQRTWRHEGGLDPAAIAQRIRWQLDGWLGQFRLRHRRSPGSIARLCLQGLQVSGARGRQGELWGANTVCPEDVLKGIARVQALVGHDSVRLPEWSGGRSFLDQYRLVSVETIDLEAHGKFVRPGPEPWPGSMPGIAPAVVCAEPDSIEVLDDEGQHVAVSARGGLSGHPTVVRFGQGRELRICHWAGPWLSEERWWDPLGHRRRARLQVVSADQRGYLLAAEARQWWLEAIYD